VLRILESAHNGRVAIVFGNEKDGLSNDELALCTHILRIPTTEKKSLNVAQAVAICCYEIFVASGKYVPEKEKSPEASMELRERMFRAWREAMVKTGFADEIRVEHMMFGLKRIFSRGAVTEDDVSILMGLARQVVWCASNMKPNVEKKNQKKVLEMDFVSEGAGSDTNRIDEDM
jgi:TrmH family RNA methyltransferase